MLGRLPLPSNGEVEVMSTAQYLSIKGIEHIFSDSFDPAHKLSFAQAPIPVLINAACLEKYVANAFNMRLLNSIFSFFTIVLLFVYFTKLERGSFKNASILLAGALLLDPLLSNKFHATHTEWIGLFFLLLSFKKEFDKDGHTFNSTIGAAFFLALAFYSSFQLVIFLPVILIYKVIRALQDLRENQYSSVYHLATWPFLFALFYCPWFFTFFDASTFYLTFLKMPSIVIMPLSESVLCAGTVVLLFYALFQNYTFDYPNVIGLCIGLIISFHVGSYFFELSPTFIIPFYYLLAFCLLPLNTTSSEARKTRYFPLAFLAVIHAVLFLIQFLYFIMSYQDRGGMELEQFVEAKISPKRHVTSDATVFYGTAFHEHPHHLVANESKLRYTINAGNYDYVLLSQSFIDQIQDSSFYNLHSENLQKIATLTYSPAPLTAFASALDIVDAKEQNLFSCVLYQYKR